MALDSASSAIGASHILRVRLVMTNVSSILVSSLCACNEYTYKHLPTCICCTYMYMTYTCAINYGEHSYCTVHNLSLCMCLCVSAAQCQCTMHVHV